MARLINPFEQFFDGGGDPLFQGKLYFYESGSSSAAKGTFADSAETIPNSNPVILSADGRCPNVFGSGTYRVILTDKDSVQIVQRDPVGGDIGITFGADWISTQIYGANDVVRDAGEYWISPISSNQNIRPSTDGGSNWIRWPDDILNATIVGGTIDGVAITASTIEGATFDNFVGAAVTASEAELNILDGVTSTTAELNILDGVTATSSELNALDASAKALSGFSYTNITYIDIAYPATAFTAGIGAAWSSVGPTGSGATYIWAELDPLPANTKAIKAKVYNLASDPSTSAVQTLFARFNGSASGITGSNRISHNKITVAGVTSVAAENISPADIAVSSKVFDLYLFSAGAANVWNMTLAGLYTG